MKLFTNSLPIVSALTYLTLISSATGAPPFVSSFYPNEETAIQPESITSGYPIPPYTLTRYDEHYGYLANPANRTDPLDVIKYIPLFNWGSSYFLTLGGDLREQYEFIQNDNFGLGSVNNHGYSVHSLSPSTPGISCSIFPGHQELLVVCRSPAVARACTGQS